MKYIQLLRGIFTGKLAHLAGVVLLAAPLRVAAADSGNGNGTDAATVASSIAEVTVYADRARVTRSGTASLRSGVARFAFPKLPGWLDEGSVRVSISPADAGEIADVQVEKTFLAKSDDEEIVKAEAAVTDISDQLAAISDERAALDAESRQADSIRAFQMDKIPKDAAVREIKPEEYSGMVKFVGDTMLGIAKNRRELDKKQRDLQPELRARQQALNDLRQRAQLEQRTVVVSVKGARDGAAKLTLTYMLPGTTWEPAHELRMAQDGKTVTLASYAIVTQTTGEDWEGVPMVFSTQRPNATARIPELDAMLLGNNRPFTQVNAGGDTFQAAVANFDRQNSLYNGFANAKNVEVQQQWGGNISAQNARQVRVEEVFQQVQQRGTTAQLAAAGAQTVRTDGRAVRVLLGTKQLAASARIVAAPEVSLNAAQTADATNTSSQPLLPGKVLLYAEGAFVGTTELGFVAPGENFSIFLGVADQVKLARTLDPKRSSLTWNGKRKRMLASFAVTAENLSDKPVTLQLADRIPVSETDEIKVIGVKLPADVKPDVNGLLKWEFGLAAKEKKEFRIEYTLDYPADLATRAPSSTVSMRSETLYHQIDTLEQSLKK